METKILTIGLVATALIFISGIFYVQKTETPTLKSNNNASVKIDNKFHNWGEIDINGGNVEKVFTVKNKGEGVLELTNIKTSCMCTEAQIIINEKESPVFGMHTRSAWKGSINPGEKAQVRVVFDPLFHGPQGVGPITRLVSINTNDPNNSTVELRLEANVIKK